MQAQEKPEQDFPVHFPQDRKQALKKIQIKHNPPAVQRDWGVTSDSESLPCLNLVLSTDLRSFEIRFPRIHKPTFP